jgi:hypothetical protein
MKGILKVGIKFEGQTGWVEYDEGKKEFKVEHPVKTVAELVTKYLNAKQEFQIPESQQIDDFRVDVVLPGENRMYAELALSSMWGKTGVEVLWSKKGSL